MLTDALLIDMHRLALAIAPELRQSPLYIFEQPDELPRPADTKAYAVSGPCTPLQNVLEARGQWQGPGPCIVFCRSMERDEALPTLLHEVAHLLPYSPPSAVEPCDPAEGIAALRSWAAAPDTACYSSLPAVRPAWHPGHGREFTRIALHLWWRAALAGVFTDFTHLCAGRVYDLSPAIFFWRGLGAEPIQMRDASFSEILLADPPQLFNDVWRADLSYWLEQHPEAELICDPK